MRGLVIAWVLLALAPQESRDSVANDWCRVEFRPADRARALELMRATGPAHARIAEKLGLAITGPVRIIAVRDQDEMRKDLLALIGREPPDWAGGLAIEGMGIVLVRTDLEGDPFDRVDSIVTHELVHVAISQAETKGGKEVPRWFEEGVAQWMAGRARPLDVPDLRPGATFGWLLELSDMDAAFAHGEGAASRAYAQAESFVRFLARRGPGTVKEVLGLVLAGLELDAAIRATTRQGLEDLWAAWQVDLAADKSWMLTTGIQIVVAILILIAVALGVGKVLRRKRTIEAKWKEEGAEESDSSAPGLP
jgi:hypothetical protein